MHVGFDMFGNIEAYCRLLKIWNSSINLVQGKTLDNVLERHVMDSLQICGTLQKTEPIVDIGSGAGFPGVILAMCGFEKVVLCEKNIKRASFLIFVKSSLKLRYQIFVGDIHKFAGCNFTSVSRAFGSLRNLCSIMTKIGSPNGVFHKGISCSQEIKDACDFFDFEYEVRRSVTCKQGAIVILTNVREKAWDA
jgi:16S rRNA (guanine527-N7)-methyltransferase